jgi:hypothetical protein
MGTLQHDIVCPLAALYVDMETYDKQGNTEAE